MKNQITTRAPFAGRICIGVGLFISSLVSLQFYQDDSIRIHQAFIREIDVHATSIEGQVNDHIAVLRSLKALFDASEFISRTEFKTFTSILLPHYPAIRAVGWIPRVSAEERDDIEMRAQQDGLDQFQITERKEQGEMIRAGSRNEYYPIYYIEPIMGNEAALAFDISSSPTRSETLYTARDTGEAHASPRITLVQETAQEWGVQVLIPVYQGNPNSLTERRETMRGLVAGVFRLHNLLVAAAAERPADGMIDIVLLDELPDGEDQVLHDDPLADTDLALAYRYERRFSPEGGRRWKLIATPSSAYVSMQRSDIPHISFVIGLLITGWTSYYLDRLTREKKKVEQQVEQRTRELRAQSATLTDSNTSLKQEIAERRLLQKRITEVADHEQRRLGQELHDSLGQQIAVMGLMAESVQNQFEASNQSVPKPLDRLAKSAKSAQAQVRALSKGLLPMEIDRWELVVALEQLAVSARDLSDVVIEFHSEEGVVVDDNIAATHLYRIAQEALRNALEHGEVSRATITLSRSEGGLTLAIRDDGKGFSKNASPSNGAGLSSMHHRADLIGATFNIESLEGLGTSVICHLPQGPGGRTAKDHDAG